MTNILRFGRIPGFRLLIPALSFIFIYLAPSVHAQMSCTGTAWTVWGAWSSCPAGSTGTDPTLTQLRSRTCQKVPVGCWIWLGAVTCWGDMSQTLVCGATTPKYAYSTIVFGTTALDETTTMEDSATTTVASDAVTTSAPEDEGATTAAVAVTSPAAAAATTEAAEQTSESGASSDSATEAAKTTAAAAGEVTSAEVEVTTDGGGAASKPATSDAVTSAEPETATDAASATVTSDSESSDASDSSDSPSDDATTVSFTFPSDAPVDPTTNSGFSDANTDYSEECGEPVTTLYLSTAVPGTLGTLFPGGVGGGGDGIAPMTFATATPSGDPGVTRNPTCRTTPIMTTTIPFRTCTMVSVSSTVAMVPTTTQMMESSTGAASEAATSDSPAASSDSSDSPSDSPEVTSQEPEVSTDSEVISTDAPIVVVTTKTSTTKASTTTASSTYKTCNDCPQINVQLFNGNPFEDASSVLNRYSAAGCYYVQFFCRPIEIGDTSPVSTILSGDTTYLNAPLSSNLACRDKKWVLLSSTAKQAANVTSLGCVYASTTTTKPKTTTIPGIDPNNPCMNCSNLVVSQSNFPEGVTYLDHTFDKCLSVEAHCIPINGGKSVEMMYNSLRTYKEAAEVNRTFTCTKNSKWLDVATNTIVNNISCIMPNEVLTTTPIVETTAELMPSTEPGPQPTPEVSVNPATDKATSPDDAPPEDEETTRADSNTQTSALETTAAGGEEASTPPAEVSSEAPSSSECSTCADLEPLAVTKAGTYNGMLVLWHYKDQSTSCRMVDVSCQGTNSPTDNATLIYNPLNKATSGIGEQVETLTCSADGLWGGKNIKTATCLATTASLIPTTTTTLRPTTKAPASNNCNACRRLPTVILGTDSGYENGLLKAVVSYDSCMKLELTCHGTTATDNVALIYEDATMASGTESVSLELSCNAAGTWITTEVQTIASISCGYTSTLLTTTALPSACGVCSNMESAKALLQTNTYDGMIVLYNYIDPKTKCKTVDISCQGTTSTENATLLFNPIGVISTGATIHELTLNCSSDGVWKYGGSTVESVSCLVSTPTEVVIPATTLAPVSTTLNPEIPLCSQCSRLNSEPVSTIDNSLQPGFTSMYFDTVGSCSQAQVTCYGNANERVTLLAATTSLVSGVTSVSFNFTCNSGASWMTNAGTVVNSVSCGRWNVTATTILNPVVTVPTVPTTPAPSKCGECSNLLAKALQPASGAYDGMIVLNHYKNSAGCRTVDISCGPTISTENATIYFGSAVVATGAKEHDFTLVCNSNSNWDYQGNAVASVSCLISTATNGVTVAPSTSTTRVINDVPAGCGECGRAPIVSVGSTTNYINGFTTVIQGTNANQCSVISIKCQGTTTGDGVALLSSGLPITSGYGSCTTNLTCSSSSTWLGSSGTVVSSLACGRKAAPVTQAVSTTITPAGLCGTCENVNALPISESYAGTYDGMVIMDHSIDPITNCRQAVITCGPTVSTENATLFINSNPVTTGLSTHTITVTCNSAAQWIYQGSGSLSSEVTSVSCLISNSADGSAPVTETTAAPVTNPAANLCSQCARLPVLSVYQSTAYQQYSNGFTTLDSATDSYGCLNINVMCEGVTSSESVQIGVNDGISIASGLGSVKWSNVVCNSQGKWTYSTLGTVSSVFCIRSAAATVATTASTFPPEMQPTLCTSCSNVRPLSMASASASASASTTSASSSYDGLIVITLQTDRATKCRHVSVTCAPTFEATESSDLYFNGNQVLANSDGQDLNITCDGTGLWNYGGESVTTASCLVRNSSTATSGKKRRKRQAGTGATACQSCGRFPIVSLQSFAPYMNGFVTLDMDDSGECITVKGVCEGALPDDDVAWIVSGTTVNTGITSKNMTFTCNSMGNWQYDPNIVFSQISCGKKPGVEITTTTVSSVGTSCANVIAAPLTAAELGVGESNGQLVLDHYIDPTIGARVVVITCYGATATSNTTISFNGGTRTISATGEVQVTITCSNTGEWIKSGIGIQTAACIVTSSTGVVEPLTTTVPPVTTTIAGLPTTSNCARQVVSVTPDGYNAGYLSMNTESQNGVLRVVMSCYAPAGVLEAKILTTDGATITSGTTMTNLTIECNSASQWVLTATSGTGVSIGSVITSLSCVVPEAASTTMMPTTADPGCRACSNLDAIGLQPYQLDSNERNGQFILDHFTDETHCRVVYLTCTGKASENSTILFNNGEQTMSNQGMTTTTLTCTKYSTWDWYGSDISDVSCKVAGASLLTTTPAVATTTALVVPGDDGLLCSRASLIRPMIGSGSGAILVLDTTIVNGVLSTKLTCSSPESDGTVLVSNGDGSVIGQGSYIINMTLTCGANAQWVISSTSLASGSSSAVGTVVSGLTCDMAASTTTVATTLPTTTTLSVASDACKACPNMQALSLSATDLASNEENGQLLIDHSVEPLTLCRVVVIKCRGTTIDQNATIYFNSNQQTLSAQYGQVSTSLACSSANQWLRAGVSITSVACKLANSVSAVSAATITTAAPVATTASSTGGSCNRAFATAVGSGYNNGFMIMDTTTSGTTTTVAVTCTAPVSSQTAVLLDSNNNQVSSGTGSVNLTLTCNANGQWVTPSGTVIQSLSCGVVPIATTAALTTPTVAPAVTTSAAAASGDCSTASWGAWMEWSTCTDTCGSCGTYQRFRTCTKPNDSCTCPGSAYEKTNCNLAVCKYPRVSCCDGFSPKSSGGTFVCMA